MAIFEGGEWWRLLMCNWLHSGVLHLGLNMGGLYSLGVPLERVFGFWRTASLYLLSGIFGTIMSAIFLPGVVSVGASGAVFGLFGAYWADIVLNYCARGDLEDTGWRGLLGGTIPNLLVGLTPWVAEPHTRAHGARSSQCTQCPCTVHRRDRRAPRGAAAGGWTTSCTSAAS